MWRKSLRLAFDGSGRGHSRVSAETRARRYSIREMGSVHFTVELRFLVLRAGQVPLPLSSSLWHFAGMLHFVSGKGRYGVEHDPGWSCGSTFCRASVLSQAEFGEAVRVILRRHTGYAEQGCSAGGFLDWQTASSCAKLFFVTDFWGASVLSERLYTCSLSKMWWPQERWSHSGWNFDLSLTGNSKVKIMHSLLF